MTVAVLCPNLQCKAVLNVPETARGKIIRCGQCGTTLRVPTGRSQRDSRTQRTADTKATAHDFTEGPSRPRPPSTRVSDS